MESITGLWEDDIPLREYTDADFESRTDSLSCYDTDGAYRDALSELSKHFGLSDMETADLATRLYLAALADSQNKDVRDNFNQRKLVPPKQWLAENTTELPQINPTAGSKEGTSQYENRQFAPATTPTVLEMVHEANEEYDVHDGLSAFVKAAIEFVVNGYELDGDRSLSNPSQSIPANDYGSVGDIGTPPLIEITSNPNQRELLDYFLSSDIPEEGYNKTEIAKESGVSPNGIRRHIDAFLDYGIIELTTSANARIEKYKVSEDSEVVQVLRQANLVLQKAQE